MGRLVSYIAALIILSSQRSIPYHPFQNDHDLDTIVSDIGKARVILIGGSTHGTHEFYETWSALTKKLITHKQFNFVAVEGDWDDSWAVNEFVRSSSPKPGSDILKKYDRWPEAMWSNTDVAEFIEWLNRYNHNVKMKIGYYGLDLYSFWEWLERPLPDAFKKIRTLAATVRDSFVYYQNDAMRYSIDVKRNKVDKSSLVTALWNAAQNFIVDICNEQLFLLGQHVLLAREGERYFRALAADRLNSWNIRSQYMAETVVRLLTYYGDSSRAIIWVHNSHSGNAEYSQMAGFDKSVAEILIERLGREKVYSIGMGTYRGTVLAGEYWNAPLQEITIPPATDESWEGILHNAGPGNKILISKELVNNFASKDTIPFRSVGDVYSGRDFYGTSVVAKRFDAFIFIDSTSAIKRIR